MSNVVGVPQKTDSSDTIALVLEIVFGIFGILGMGWLYAGNIAVAIALFIGFAILIFLEALIGMATLGLAICFFLPLNIAIAVISGIKARDHMRNNVADGSIFYVVVGLAAGAVVVCGGLGIIGAVMGAIGSGGLGS